MREVQIGKIYKHFKGCNYKVINIATHTENLEKMVVYQSLKDNQVWVRPYDLFNSFVEKEKYPEVEQLYRFEEC